MFKKIKYWLLVNRPILTTKKKYDTFILFCMERLEKQRKLSVWSAINPVIHDLERLRANTWDQEQITKIQKWLKDNFEVKR